MSSNQYFDFAAGSTPTTILAELIIQDHPGPDFSTITICLPHYRVNIKLKQALLQVGGYTAILAPKITTMKRWADQFSHTEGRYISSIERHLLMIDVLRKYQHLFPESDLWFLSHHLFQLLDELTRNQISIPENLEKFIDTLQSLYSAPTLKALGREAHIIHLLWHAWKKTLQENQFYDADHAYKQVLSIRDLEQASMWYFFSEDQWLIDEWRWLQRQCGATVLLPDYAYYNASENIQPVRLGISHPGVELLLAAHKSGKENIRQRAQQFAVQHPQCSLHKHITFLPCKEWEQEVTTCVRIVRQWLSDGFQSLCIITEDRLFARRLRACLESTGILLHDSAGWIMSTTSAATVIERWLECIEQDFPYCSLLDILKSPFMFQQHKNMRELVLMLQRDIVEKENIRNNLGRMRHAIERRQKNFSINSQYGSELFHLLENLEKIAQPMLDLQQQKIIGVECFIQLLIQALGKLQLDQSLQKDTAGEQIWQRLQIIQTAAEQQPVQLDWHNCRTWLAQELDAQHFIPFSPQGSVWLSDIKGVRGMQFDGVIVAAADEQHLPIIKAQNFFFNDNVRRELGLETQEDHCQRAYQRLTHLILGARQALFSYSCETNQGPQLPGIWIEMLDTFYQLAWKQSLENTAYRQLMLAVDPDPVSEPIMPPQPVINQFPQKISVSQHQNLIDCPYKFFSQSVLHLRAREEVKNTLSSREYGQKVHHCLQAFHIGDKQLQSLPGPFPKAVNNITREEAITFLTTIAEKEFRFDITNDLRHRYWLERFKNIIPAYIDWQSKQQGKGWKITHMEMPLSVTVAKTTLYGRVDAIEKNQELSSLLDFKTGKLSKIEDLENGEDIQLSSYALMYDQLQYIQYVQLDKKKINAQNEVADTLLKNIKQKTAARLSTIINAIENGQELLAQPNKSKCQHCNFSGLCRHVHWHD